MKLWRVVHFDPRRAHPWDTGGELHVIRDWQGAGRFDLPDYATTLYLAESPQAAVGETFGTFPKWGDAMLWSGTTGLRRALVEFEVDVRGLVDLDDASFLADRNIKPSEVVNRNRERTKELALGLFLAGYRVLRWWSYYRPEWRLVSLWDDTTGSRPWASVVEVIASQELSVGHPAVEIAANVLGRELRK